MNLLTTTHKFVMSQSLSITDEVEELPKALTAQLRALAELPRVRDAIIRDEKSLSMNRLETCERVIVQSYVDHPEQTYNPYNHTQGLFNSCAVVLR